MKCDGHGMSAPASLTEPVFPPLAINPELVRKILVRFIQNEVQKVGFERVVLGLSGGVRFGLAAALVNPARTARDVLLVHLAGQTTWPNSRTAAHPFRAPRRLQRPR